MTHATLISVDGHWAGFGSYNMSELEGLTQKDLMAFPDNPDLLEQFHQLIETDLRHSVLLDSPTWTYGPGSYRLLHNFLRWWARYLVENEKWTAIYG